MSSLGYNALCIVISILVSWSICLSSTFEKWSRISYKEDSPFFLSLWWNFCCSVWFREVFYFVYHNLFVFFHPRLLVGVYFQYSQVLEVSRFSSVLIIFDLAFIFLPLFVFSHFLLRQKNMFLDQITFLYLGYICFFFNQSQFFFHFLHTAFCPFT